jgi:hypothetical protein
MAASDAGSGGITSLSFYTITYIMIRGYLVTAILLYFTGYAFAQQCTASSREASIQSKLKATTWLKHQYVELHLSQNYILVGNAVEAADLKRNDSLTADASLTIEKIGRMLTQDTRDHKLMVTVLYFDKHSYLAGRLHLSTGDIFYGFACNFKNYRQAPADSIGSETTQAIFPLTGFTLAPSQYLRPFYSPEKDNNHENNVSKYDAVCLVNIVDSSNEQSGEESERQANKLFPYLKNSNTFHRVAVRFQLRSDSTKWIEIVYRRDNDRRTVKMFSRKGL